MNLSTTNMKDVDATNNGGTPDGWKVVVSNMARDTFNPIRNILETMNIVPNPEKPMISLSIGDPTIFKNLGPHQNAIEAMVEALRSNKFNGYAPTTGFPEARKAVAEHVSCGPNSLSANDVILCSGCSCALDLCISVLAHRGENILVPRPGFPVYKTLANGLGIETREYDLLPERKWECDLEHLESIIDDNTRALVVTNPSNPCGSVFSKEHLLDILNLAKRHKVPIIADEIYEHFVFSGSETKYVPIASLTDTVPILSCGGLTKRYLVPGWRLGWITIHDRNDVFKRNGIRSGLNSLSQRIIGSNTIVQGALPRILLNTPASFFWETLRVIESNAKLAYNSLSKIPGLHPVMPDGAMYMMVGVNKDIFPDFENCVQIVESLVKEQSVFCLPGKCFNIEGFFRIVLTVPEEMLTEACSRIAQFCFDHRPNKKLHNHICGNVMDVSSTSVSSSSAVSSADEYDDYSYNSGRVTSSSVPAAVSLTKDPRFKITENPTNGSRLA